MEKKSQKGLCTFDHLQNAKGMSGGGFRKTMKSCDGYGESQMNENGNYGPLQLMDDFRMVRVCGGGGGE